VGESMYPRFEEAGDYSSPTPSLFSKQSDRVSAAKNGGRDMKRIHIEQLKVQNFRTLQNVEFDRLSPLTVLVGANGSGKSAVFDVFAFLAECFEVGLRRALNKRGRVRELRSRNAEGPISIEIGYREGDYPPITYHLSVDEKDGSPVVVEEWMEWQRGAGEKPLRFLEYREGKGRAIAGELPGESDRYREVPLKSADLLAVGVLGQFGEHPRVVALRDFIGSWFSSYLSADSARSLPEAAPQERLSRTGDNLASVIQFLLERHPDRLGVIFEALRHRIPHIEKVLTETTADGRLLLRVKDAPFSQPVLARFASDGALKLLAYLVLLYDPAPPPFVGIEEPENFLHPRLLEGLAEECRQASERTQLLVTTHSPFFVNALRPEEVWVLWRDERGYTQSKRAANVEGVADFVREGGLLGELWMEGYLGDLAPLYEKDTYEGGKKGRTFEATGL